MSDSLFDVETDFALSQFDLQKFIAEEEKMGNFPYSQKDLDDEEDFSLTKKQCKERFKRPVSARELEATRNLSFPANTVKNTTWGVKTYDAWGSWRNDYITKNGQSSSEPYSFVPPLSADLTAIEVDYWMARFVVEVKRQDGSEYPAESIKQLCTSIWRYLRDTCKRYDLNPFDKSNPTFSNFQHVLDGRMKEIEKAKPHVPKQAEPISSCEEQLLWEKVFGNHQHDSRFLSYAVYYYNCKIFALRAADEHTSLEVDQYSFGKNEVGAYLQFQGKQSKNCQGGIYHKKSNKKCIKQYENSENPRCVVKLFKFYLSVISSSVPFYKRPLVGTTSNGMPKFSKQNVGRHTIQGYMAAMCKEAGISGRKTGHSGKVTTATTLFQGCFDEQLIKERTGHKRDAVRAYKRTSESQIKEISDALQPPMPKELITNNLEKGTSPVKVSLPSTLDLTARSTTTKPTQRPCHIKVTRGDVSVELNI